MSEPENHGSVRMDDAGAGGGSPLDAILESDLAKERPEVLVGGAFVGAFVLAKLLKAIGGGS